MAKFFLPLCLLALFLHGSTAQFGFGSSPWQSSRYGAQSQCRFERLSALEPKRRVKSEGGVTEYFDNNNEQLKCAGLAAIRRTIQPQGLALPSYFNAPHLIYILKGRGVAGAVIPGCPETFQSSSQQQQQPGQKQQSEQQHQGQKQQGDGQKQQGEQQQQGEKQHGQKQQGEQQQQGEKQHGQKQQGEQQKHQGQKQQGEQQQQKQQGEQQQQGQQQQQTGDQHQRILQFRQGDILAIPAGMVHWCYNDGDSPVVAVTVLDTSNNANQLDNNPRKFSLAGQDESSSNNVFRGFDLQFLADALGVSRELTKKLQQGQNGEIVKVQRGLRMVMPPRSEREEKQEEESEGRQEEKGQSEGRQEKEKGGQSNGLEQAFCTLRFRENIDKPSRADVYNPQAGRYTHLNGQKLPILNFIQMSAARGVLYQGATIAPHWNINAHSFIYVTGGRGRIQIVSDQGRSVFDDEIHEGQMVVVPQHFAAVMQAREQQFEWVSFKTNGNAIASQIVGPGSFFRGLPGDVIAESYKGISRGEARNLKDQDSLLVPPRSSQQGGRAEA